MAMISHEVPLVDWKTQQGFSKRISLCRKVGRWQEAAYLLARMRVKKLVPNSITCNMVISCLARAGCWQLAVALLSEMPQIQAAPDLISYNSAISACEAAGEWENTLALLEALESAELQPDVICYSGVISACAKGGFWRLTTMLLERLSAQRMHPDLVALNSALGAYKGPRWQMAISTLSSFPTLRLMPDVVSFCTAISCCEEAWPKALQLLDMRSLHSRLAQDVFGYSSAMSCLASDHASGSASWPATLDMLADMLGRQTKLARVFFSRSPAMDLENVMLICIYILQFLTALKLLSKLVQLGLKVRSHWSDLFKRLRQLVGQFQEWQKSESRATRFFERTLCRLLQSSSQVMLVALFLRLLVVQWHLLLHTPHMMQPALDLSNLLAYALLLLLCSWPQLVTPQSLDVWYIVLQVLCILPLFSTKPADVTMVSLVTLLPRFLLALCCRHMWLAVLGGTVHWIISLQSVWGFPSGDLVMAQTAELMVFFAGMVTMRHQMYENVRVSLSLQKRSIELGAVSSLLYGFCDAVVELDDELKIANTANQLSTMLLRSLGSPPPNLVGSEFLRLFLEEDREPLKSSLCSASVTSRVSARMVDALGSTVQLELLHTLFRNEDQQTCRLVGMRELQEAADVAPLKAPRAGTESNVSLLFDACTFELLGATDAFKRMMRDFGSFMDDLDQMSIYDLLGPEENSIALVSSIQSAVNSFDSERQVQVIQLGSLEILNHKVEAVLTLQNDELLKTVVGTLAVSLGATARTRSKTRSHRVSPRPHQSHIADGRSGSILDLRKDHAHASL
eukprot:s265_g40.t2